MEISHWATTTLWFGEPDPATKQVLEATTDQLMAAIREKAPKKIRNMYQELIDGVLRERYPGEGSYKRRKFTRIFELLLEAEHKPFADPHSPYDYPCFDLGQTPSEDLQEVLLAVDIHT